MLELPRGPLGPTLAPLRPLAPAPGLATGPLPSGEAVEALAPEALVAVALRPDAFEPRRMPARDRLLLLRALVQGGAWPEAAVARTMGAGIMAPELGLASTPLALLSWLEHAEIPRPVALRAIALGVVALAPGHEVCLVPGALPYVELLLEVAPERPALVGQALGRVGQALGQAHAVTGHLALIPKLSQLMVRLPKELSLVLVGGALAGAKAAGMGPRHLAHVEEAFAPILPEALPAPWTDPLGKDRAIAHAGGHLPDQGAQRTGAA